jgi:hypothetical protein
MRVPAVLLVMAVCAAPLSGCGADPAPRAAAQPVAPDRRAVPRVSTAPAPCAAVVARTLRTIAGRIEARAALHRRAPGDVPVLVDRLTRPAPARCGRSPVATVANSVGAVGERLVRIETSGPDAVRALRVVTRDPRFVRAVRRHDPAALRTAIVRFFRMRSLHIVRVRATTPGGRPIGDVGGPYVIAPASRTIRDARGRAVGRATLSVQDDAGYIKLMRRFAGAGVVLRTADGVVPGSARAPSAIPARGIVAIDGTRYATFAFTTRAFPARRLEVALLVPVTPASG